MQNVIIDGIVVVVIGKLIVRDFILLSIYVKDV